MAAVKARLLAAVKALLLAVGGLASLLVGYGGLRISGKEWSGICGGLGDQVTCTPDRIMFPGTRWDPGVGIYAAIGLGFVALAVFLFVLAQRAMTRRRVLRARGAPTA